MTTTYFAGLTTPEEIKKAYRDLARQHHPDLGGDLETMKAINAAYHAALSGQNGSVNDGRTYKYNHKAEQEIMDVIAELLKLPNLEISLIGYWVWVQGDTKPCKDQLKARGCRWHSGRSCWYWKPAWCGKSRSNPGGLETLAAKYGYQGFTSKAQQPARRVQLSPA
jgi:hypothetical protein